MDGQTWWGGSTILIGEEEMSIGVCGWVSALPTTVGTGVAILGVAGEEMNTCGLDEDWRT